MSNYYLSNGIDRKGPFPAEELIRNGMTPDSLVWCNGMAGWTRASEVTELSGYFTAQPLQYQQPSYGQPQYQQPAYGQSQYPQYPQYAQGQYGSVEARPPKPDSYMVWAILTTLFCCLPLGIVSIVKAAKVDDLYNRGDYSGAQTASEEAKKWATWSAVSSLLIVVLYFVVVLIAVAVNGGF
ncbi:MAG: CD225/dispanin family protein [Muribaculaceae bacterium]|nr:CD225/dispanin family protein [Muribaculaceae bacterium]